MVKKLLKHELLSYLHTLPFVYIVLLGAALMGRCARFFESTSAGYVVLNSAFTTALWLGSFAAVLLTVLFCIVRFYRNLFGKEGYLTLALPVGEGQHLFTKLIGAVVANITTILVIVLSFHVLYAGEWMVEIWKSVAHLLGRLREDIGGQMWLYMAELLLLTLVSTAAGMLTYYLCICIGQTARRGRIIIAIVIYYGLSLLMQTALILLYLAYNAYYDALEPLMDWIDHHPYVFAHLLFCGGAVIHGLWGAVCFALSRRIMRRKLNLN